ncbi:MAG: hypothetical protein AB7K71_21675 [Polyangiaceae bacterium]
MARSKSLESHWLVWGQRSPVMVAGFALLSAVACGDDGSTGSGSGGSAGAGASGGSGGSSAEGGSGNGGSTSGGSSSGGTAGAGNGGSAAGGAGGNGGSGAGPGTQLDARIETHDVTLPEGVQAGVCNWRIWGRGSLNVAPVFTVPRGNCSILVCYTTQAGTAKVAEVGRDGTLISTKDLAQDRQCRGLAAEPDGAYAALLWDDAGDRIFLQRYAADGSERGTATELTNSDNKPDDFGIGESRLEYGDGRYGAYYHVHSDSGHEGDTLKWIDAQSGAETTGWGWGCSHSMSNLLRFNPTSKEFMPVCVTDCYPGTSGDFATESQGGVFLNHNKGKVIDVDAGCNGSVAGELGGAAIAPDGFKLVWNSHQAAMTKGQQSYDESSMNQDIGFSAITGVTTAGAVVWLTNTPNIDEADSGIARFTPADSSQEQYLVGWAEPGNSYKYQLALLGPDGAFLEGPIDVSSSVAWGRRDDPFRADVNGDVIWSWFDAPGSTTLHVARVVSGSDQSCSP